MWSFPPNETPPPAPLGPLGYVSSTKGCALKTWDRNHFHDCCPANSLKPLAVLDPS